MIGFLRTYQKACSLFIAIFIAFLLSGNTTFAQTISCQTPAEKVICQQQLTQVEAEQKQAAADLASAQNQSASLKRDIAVLDAKIKTAQLNIKAKNLLIATLGNDITSKQSHINSLETSIDKGKATLATILRKTNEMDSSSLPEILLSQASITGFFTDLDMFQAVEDSLKTTFTQLRSDEATTKTEKDDLTNRQNSAIDARYAIEQDQKNIQSDQNSKQQLLSISKGNEKSYATLLAEKQAKAAKIRAALFSLRDAASIPFEQALQYATESSKKTGVRPAFLLAIITQESSLGKNVGSCYLSDPQTGSGIGAKTGSQILKVMSPSRDVPPFMTITSAIGADPFKTLVSCPQQIGWGGAMGPAQFIASTWLLMKNEIATALSITVMPDPWNPMHAFMASSIYLSNLGAYTGSYTAEKNAACKYYSGKSCGLVTGNTTYGNSVMTLADNIQRNMIDPLQGL